ncbi:MAG TPA: hypothetical protein VFT45_25705 [Longimicrobium sp.]|nr:hypothetical protein [Longimicrobium sp.]
MKRISAVLLVASVAACAPVVTHGPRVEAGTSLVATAGASYSTCDEEACDLALLPQASLGLRTGRPAGQAAPGLSAGGSLSLNLLSSDVDLYAQAPTGLTGALEAGGGVLLSLAHTMPYVQLGRTAADGSGWYTTQGFVWMSRRQADYTLTGGLDEEEPDEMRPRYWAPSIAYRTRGASGLQVYAAGAFGTADVYAFDDAQKVGRQPVRFLMAGVIVQGSPELLLPWRF